MPYKLAEDLEVLALASKLLDGDQKAFLVYDTRQARQLAKHFGPDTGLIDLDLEGKDGLRLIQEFRTSFPNSPIIVVSSILGVR